MGEIWGDKEWVEAERVQIQIAKRIMRAFQSTTDEAVLGDIGWMPLKAIWDIQRLVYWGKLIRSPFESIQKKVYLWERKELEKQLGEGKPIETIDIWCAYTLQLLRELGLDSHWTYENCFNIEATRGKTKEEISEWEENNILTLKQWKSLVKKKITEREENRWKERMFQSPKLRTYRTLKHEYTFEKYLADERLTPAVRQLLFKLRSGSNDLEIEQQRYLRPLVPPSQRLCKLCYIESETEEHFLTRCPALSSIRKQIWDELKQKTRVDLSAVSNANKILTHMIGMGMSENADTRFIVAKGIWKMKKRRQKILNPGSLGVKRGKYNKD
jgi:hypothetical protein